MKKSATSRICDLEIAQLKSLHQQQSAQEWREVCVKWGWLGWVVDLGVSVRLEPSIPASSCPLALVVAVTITATSAYLDRRVSSCVSTPPAIPHPSKVEQINRAAVRLLLLPLLLSSFEDECRLLRRAFEGSAHHHPPQPPFALQQQHTRVCLASIARPFFHHHFHRSQQQQHKHRPNPTTSPWQHTTFV